ncbi:MAG: YraN family protein [Pseudomonadota bacterium]
MAIGSSPRQQLGEQHERAAHRFLCAQGLKPIDKNFRCKTGELDLIFSQDNTLTIAEVRYRSRQDFGGAAASIGQAKQQRIVRATETFLQRYPVFRHCSVRFDIVAINALANNSAENPEIETSIEWLQDAFRPGFY